MKWLPAATAIVAFVAAAAATALTWAVIVQNDAAWELLYSPTVGLVACFAVCVAVLNRRDP